MKNLQLFDLLENHGVLSKVVRIKLNKLNEIEKLSLQKFCTASNEYLRFTPIKDIGGHKEEELSIYKKNLANKNIYGLLINGSIIKGSTLALLNSGNQYVFSHLRRCYERNSTK